MSKCTVAAMLVRLLNDLHKAGRPIWGAGLFGVKVFTQPSEITKFNNLRNRKWRDLPKTNR